MSWIVEHLVKNRDSIRALYGNNEGLDSEVYNNLLTLEQKIKSLQDYGILSDLDMIILYSYNDLEIKEKLNQVLRDRHAVSKAFSQICDRIGYFLGGYFTDDGFIANLAETYKLNDVQIDEIKNYMSSRFRHKLRRRIKTNG